MSNIIAELEKEQIEGKEIPDFRPGDTIVVSINVTEGERKRLQAFEGLVIAKRNRGLNSAFTVRISIKRRGAVRRAKLYYMRDRRGKAARIKEKIVAKKAH